MRLTGFVLLVGGVLAFFYCSTRLSGLAPVPAEVALGDYFQYEAGKWEIARYGSALAAMLGALISLFPKGR